MTDHGCASRSVPCRGAPCSGKAVDGPAPDRTVDGDAHTPLLVASRGELSLTMRPVHIAPLVSNNASRSAAYGSHSKSPCDRRVPARAGRRSSPSPRLGAAATATPDPGPARPPRTPKFSVQPASTRIVDQGQQRRLEPVPSTRLREPDRSSASGDFPRSTGSATSNGLLDHRRLEPVVPRPATPRTSDASWRDCSRLRPGLDVLQRRDRSIAGNWLAAG